MENRKEKDRPLYSSRSVDIYIKLIKAKYSFIDIEKLLHYAGIEYHQVKDEGHYFTQQQINLFQKRLRELTGNANISREAGRFAASQDVLGVMRRTILGLIGPTKAYEFIGKYANIISRSSEYKSKRISANSVEITVTPYEGVREEQFQCDNRMGWWEALSTLFNYKAPHIKHPECLFKGDKVCRYIVSWHKSSAVIWKRVRDFAALLLGIGLLGFALHFTPPKGTLALYTSLSAIVVLVLSWYAQHLKIKDMNKAIDSLRDSSEDLIDQINLNYDNALMLNEIGQTLSKESDIDGILTKISMVLKKRLDYDRGLVLLANPDRTRLIPMAGYGYTREQLNILRRAAFSLDKKESQGMFVASFRDQKPILLDNIDEAQEKLSSYSLEFAKKMGVKSFICCPVIIEGDSLGILAVDNIISKRPLLQRDINLLMGVAQQIGTSIHNTRLVEARLRQFRAILQVLAATTDARDPITAGHSEKVTKYAVGICRELGLAKDYCEMIRVASLLHDYGKIGVDDAILKKPGRLTSEEYDEIKTHVIKTREILEQVNFEGV